LASWPEVQRLTIVVAIFSVLFLWQHGELDEFFESISGFLTG
jgi:hypothetical protein